MLQKTSHRLTAYATENVPQETNGLLYYKIDFLLHTKLPCIFAAVQRFFLRPPVASVVRSVAVLDPFRS